MAKIKDTTASSRSSRWIHLVDLGTGIGFPVCLHKGQRIKKTLAVESTNVKK